MNHMKMIGFKDGFITNTKRETQEEKVTYLKKYSIFLSFGIITLEVLIYVLYNLNHYQTISIVIIGTSLAALVWTYFLKEIILILNQISSNGALIILVMFILFTIIVKVLKSKKNDEKESNL